MAHPLWSASGDVPPLESGLAREVLDRLGVRLERADLQALTDLYRAWGERLAMENVSKRVRASRSDNPLDAAVLPEETFAWFLEYGSSGTCWASMEGFVALAKAAGFDARPRLGEMLGPGQINHGAVVVVIDGTEFSCDQNLMWPAPLPLSHEQEPTRVEGPHYTAEALWQPERRAWRIRRFSGDREFQPTTLLDGETRREQYLPYWKSSFERSYFNNGIFVNRLPGGTWRQIDTVKSLYQEYAGAGAPFVEGAPPTGEALPQFVEERFGLAAALVEESLGGQ